MYLPSRIRRILKWTGAVFCVLIVIVWFASYFWLFARVDYREIAVLCGRIQLSVFAGTRSEYDAIPTYESDGRTPARPGPTIRHGRINSPHSQTLWASFRFPFSTVTHFPNGRPSRRFLSIPLWLPLLLAAIPTAWLWHRDRLRIRPGCCLRCGYDLTGNTSGVCSECGLAKPPPLIV